MMLKKLLLGEPIAKLSLVQFSMKSLSYQLNYLNRRGFSPPVLYFAKKKYERPTASVKFLHFGTPTNPFLDILCQHVILPHLCKFLVAPECHDANCKLSVKTSSSSSSVSGPDLALRSSGSGVMSGSPTYSPFHVSLHIATIEVITELLVCCMPGLLQKL